LIINLILLTITTLFLILFFVSSILEKETRAVVISFIALLANSVLWTGFIILGHLKVIRMANLIVISGIALFSLISLIHWFPRRKKQDLKPESIEKYDERDYMFSRNNLKFFPDLAKKYYSTHPEKLESDRKLYERPELGEPGHVFYDDLYSPMFEAAFKYLNRTKPASKGEKAVQQKKLEPEIITRAIKELALFYGAKDVGVVALKPYHLYSHAGRHAENWGKEIKNSHKYAIAIVAAMDPQLMKTAPSLPIILESSRLYVETAKIASIVAEYIRGFGYDARAHTDGNYEVLCVPIAVDSGIGELGRLGIFIHPVYGPCVRISVVTTDLELEPTHTRNYWIREFCEICKKCADNCPTKSISRETEPCSRGFCHWSIDQDKCFAFWKNVGTDCGVCIGVCPYTKPNTLIHKLVRFYITRNPINQQIALLMDDLFYGRKRSLPSKNPEKMIYFGR
jgi:reductive dehalogenase